MTSATATKLITAEEFLQMPEPKDGSRQELVRGVIVTMPPPAARHGACCSKIVRRLGNFVEDNRLGTVLCNDAGFISERDPDTVRGPDVSFWNRERLPELPDGYVPIPPDLAVEVVSPNDHYTRVQNKVRDYLTKGVRLIWVIDPEDRSVTVYRATGQMTILTETGTLSGEEVVLGFTCRVADLFS
jgi:Uma2 family endonuclease